MVYNRWVIHNTASNDDLMALGDIQSMTMCNIPYSTGTVRSRICNSVLFSSSLTSILSQHASGLQRSKSITIPLGLNNPMGWCHCQGKTYNPSCVFSVCTLYIIVYFIFLCLITILCISYLMTWWLRQMAKFELASGVRVRRISWRQLKLSLSLSLLMPPQHGPKLKVNTIKNDPNDTQGSSLGLAAPVPSPPTAVQSWRAHSHVPVSSYLSVLVATYFTSTRLKWKLSKMSTKSCRKTLPPLLPHCPLVLRLAVLGVHVPVCQWGCYISYVEGLPSNNFSALKVVANNESREEIELPDVISDCISPQVEPMPEGGLLTPQLTTLGTATLDSDAGPPVSNMDLFFDESKNKESEMMRWCRACL